MNMIINIVLISLFSINYARAMEITNNQSQSSDKQSVFASLAKRRAQEIWCAVVAGQESLVESFLKKDSALANSRHDGITLLHAAFATRKSVRMVELLLNNGAEIEGKVNIWTPLMWCVFANNKEMVELLCKRGANVNFADKVGDTPLHICRKSRANQEIESILLNYGAREYIGKESKEEVVASNNNVANIFTQIDEHAFALNENSPYAQLLKAIRLGNEMKIIEAISDGARVDDIALNVAQDCRPDMLDILYDYLSQT